MEALTILTIADAELRPHLRALITAVLPDAAVTELGPEAARHLPTAAALIVTDAANARGARAAGFDGGIVVASDDPDPDHVRAFRAQGTEFVNRHASAAELADALARASAGPNGRPTTLHAHVLRARRLLAAGEIAFDLQHALYNPLTALLAEAQLLQVEASTPEIEATAGRMVDLVRRLTEIIRSLDAVRDRPPAL